MIKRNEGKLSYREISWNFIKGIAHRMNKNKDSGSNYPVGNWKIQTDEQAEEIQDALTRHFLAYQSKDFSQDSELDQIEAMSCNLMFLHDYLLRKSNKVYEPFVLGQRSGGTVITSTPTSNPYNAGHDPNGLSSTYSSK